MADPSGQERFYAFGPFRLHHQGRLLLRDRNLVALEPKQLDTLLALVEAKGCLLTKEDLFKRVWPDVYVEETNLTRIISVLRKTLGNGRDGVAYIETLPKRGYRFAGEIRELDDSLPFARRRRTRRTLITAGLVLLATLIAAAYFWLRPGRVSVRQAIFTKLTDQPGPELHVSLSPDGNLFAYAGRAEGNWDIYLQRTGGRNAINLTRDCPFDDTQPAFSPDGQRIAFRSERDGGGIFVMGATGESVMRAADFGYHPAWSPDGGKILCATAMFRKPNYRRSTGSRLFAVSLETPPLAVRQWQIAGPEDAVQPAWSPHGHRIAYWGLRGGNRDIWTVPAEGGEPVAVTADSFFDWNPVWSPDGRHLWFASDRAGSMACWRVRIDEKSGKRLAAPEQVATPSPYSGYLSFARDGKRMAYVQHLWTGQLHKASFDPVRETISGKPAPLTRGSLRAGSSDLSPDGQWVAFNTQTTPEDIFLIRSDGTGLRQLTNDGVSKRVPKWSPDGSRIAYMCARSGKYEIWTMHADGSAQRQLTFESRGPALRPVWSPDGKRLLYSVQGLGSYILDVGKPWPQQAPQDVGSPYQPGIWFWAGAWSPDGSSIAGDLQDPTGSYSGIAVYSLPTRTFRRLTRFGSVAGWLSDNRRLIFQDEDTIYLLDSRSGRVRALISVAPHGLGGAVITLARDDRTIAYVQETTEADVWLMSLP